jgi:hypothetical protein
MLASTNRDSRTNRFRFTFLLLREKWGDDEVEGERVSLLTPPDRGKLYNKIFYHTGRG